MKQLVQSLRSGEVKVEEVPAPALKSGGVVVRSVCSLVSAGTERMTTELAGRNLLEKAKKRPDLVKQVINKVRTEGLWSTCEKVMDKLDAPVSPGYSSAGTVIQVSPDVQEFQKGDAVACAGMGYASHAEQIFVPKNLCVKIPEKVSFESAAFTTLGAIALQGVRIAEVSIGEEVLVIGLGLVGQLTTQILKAAGCRVAGIDLDEWKVALARRLGIEGAWARSEFPVPDGTFRGFDVVIITAATESDEPVEMAGELARDKGKVVVVGAVGMRVPRKIYYEKELQLRLSRSYGPGRYDPSYEERGVDYPHAYVRWTEQRNMEAFLELVANGSVRVDPLITHRFDISEALKGYELITGKTNESYLGILLQYPQTDVDDLPKTIRIGQRATGHESRATRINVGFIGAGNFARTVLLPKLKRFEGIDLTGVATATGVSARFVAEKFGFTYCTTSFKDILDDISINTVFIATRHNLHAPLVIEALRRGKRVFVEKPLCLNEEELDRIIECAHECSRIGCEPMLMVGFNRRFSPLAEEVKHFYRDRKEPMIINYRINAGALPAGSWLQDASEGGGRIIGEVCHFIDFMAYLTGSVPTRVFAESASSDLGREENASVTIKFSDGSIGSILYLCNGDKSLPKERIEIFSQGSVAIIDDFKRIDLIRNGRKRTFKKFAQDKGHQKELQTFIDAIKFGKLLPIGLADAVYVTLTTFKILESLRTGTPIKIADCGLRIAD